MEQRYSKKNNPNTEGPSELTIKRILAFSKALNAHKKESKHTSPKKKI